MSSSSEASTSIKAPSSLASSSSLSVILGALKEFSVSEGHTHNFICASRSFLPSWLGFFSLKHEIFSSSLPSHLVVTAQMNQPPSCPLLLSTPPQSTE